MEPHFSADDTRDANSILAASLLSFRRKAMDALDELLVDMIRDGSAVGVVRFEKAPNRPVALALAFGEDAVPELISDVEDIEEHLKEND